MRLLRSAGSQTRSVAQRLLPAPATPYTSVMADDEAENKQAEDLLNAMKDYNPTVSARPSAARAPAAAGILSAAPPALSHLRACHSRRRYPTR